MSSLQKANSLSFNISVEFFIIINLIWEVNVLIWEVV